jgi:LysR family hydrogen peroxide-inducible transcriptional activator
VRRRGGEACVDLVQIRYFLALADTLNFTRAAERCHVTQPALTRSIPLRLGLCSLVTAAVLVPVLRELASRFAAALELTLTHGTSAELTEMLLRGELDAALLPEAQLEAERLNRWPLFEDSLVVLAPAGHRFAALDAVPVAALEGETVLVCTEEGCALRRALDRLRCSAGVEVRLRHRASSGESIAHMVGAGLGIALAAGCQSTTDGVVRRPLDDAAARQRIMLAAVAGRPAGRAADAFVKLARARDWTQADKAAAAP